MLREDYIIKSVDRLVQKYHTNDPFALCRHLDIKIHYLDLEKKLKGFFFYQSRQKNIVIDENVNEILRRILVAHELGHALLHADIAMMRGFQEMEVLDKSCDSRENEANLFSAELLLKDEDVLSHLREESFFEAAKSLYVPASLLDYKFVLLRKKGYQLRPMDVRSDDYLKKDLGDYTNAAFEAE